MRLRPEIVAILIALSILAKAFGADDPPRERKSLPTVDEPPSPVTALYKTPQEFKGIENDLEELKRAFQRTKVELPGILALRAKQLSYLEIEQILGKERVSGLAAWERLEFYKSWTEREYTKAVRHYFWLRAAIMLTSYSGPLAKEDASELLQLAQSVWINPETSHAGTNATDGLPLYVSWISHISDDLLIRVLNLAERGMLKYSDLIEMGFSVLAAKKITDENVGYPDRRINYIYKYCGKEVHDGLPCWGCRWDFKLTRMMRSMQSQRMEPVFIFNWKGHIFKTPDDLLAFFDINRVDQNKRKIVGDDGYILVAMAPGLMQLDAKFRSINPTPEQVTRWEQIFNRARPYMKVLEDSDQVPDKPCSGIASWFKRHWPKR